MQIFGLEKGADDYDTKFKALIEEAINLYFKQ